MNLTDPATGTELRQMTPLCRTVQISAWALLSVVRNVAVVLALLVLMALAIGG